MTNKNKNTKSEQIAFLQFVGERVTLMEEAKRNIQAIAHNIMKALKEYQVLAEGDEECTAKVKTLLERIFWLL